MKKSDMVALVLRHKGATAAEEELVKIAEAEGDEAIARLAEDMTGAQISEVTARADLVRPSIFHGTISAKKFVEVWKRVGTKWKAAGRDVCDSNILLAYQEELGQFFCAFILLSDDPRKRVELLTPIVNDGLGLDSLLFATIHEKEFPEFLAADGRNDSIGDWREMIEIVAHRFPERWGIFKQSAVEALVSKSDYHAFCHDCAQSIYYMALAESGVHKTTRLSEEQESKLFTPLR